MQKLEQANADPGVKAKWEAARSACAALLEQAISQKDPLEQRAQRLKLTEDTLADPAADPAAPRGAIEHSLWLFGGATAPGACSAASLAAAA